MRYRLIMGSWIDWNHPTTFTEKIQWLKVYGYKTEYSQVVDKLAAKEYIKKLIGEQYIIPTLAVWDRVEEIDINKLPEKFVLKTTHGGGGTGVVICLNKAVFDTQAAMAQLSESMATIVGKEFREKPYYDVPRKILAEQFMQDKNTGDNSLIDYKFYCFNGEPKYCQVIRNRTTKETIDFYDTDWNLMHFVGLNPQCENGNIPLPKPDCLEEMLTVCCKLSQAIPFCRVDLYNIENRPYFGEITFYPGGGFGRFSPEDWNYKLGSLITLPHEN